MGSARRVYAAIPADHRIRRIAGVDIGGDAAMGTARQNIVGGATDNGPYRAADALDDPFCRDSPCAFDRLYLSLVMHGGSRCMHDLHRAAAQKGTATSASA
jgi:hypothetical protein